MSDVTKMAQTPLPDFDLPTPTETIGIWKGAAVNGREVVALPGINPRMSLTLDVYGFENTGWYLQVTDPHGTVVWHRMLQGLDTIEDVMNFGRD